MYNKLKELIDLVPSERIFLKSNKVSLSYGELKLKIDGFYELYGHLKGKRCAISSDSRVSLAIYLPCIESLTSLVFLQPNDCTDKDLNDFYSKSSIDYLIQINNDSILVKTIIDKNNDFIDVNNWLLATSGTSGTPKLALYSLNSLLSSSLKDLDKGKDFRWGVCYDLNRFAGLQVYLQALSSGSCLVVPDSKDSFPRVIELFLNSRVNALSATPSYWRKLLMTPSSNLLNLKRISLGGEIADQAIIDGLSRAFQNAKIVHIYASTEAGVGFSVKDNLEGFPLSYVQNPSKELDMKIHENELWIRTGRGASKLLADNFNTDSDGYINSGDLVEVIDDRILFKGRTSGTINVGGNKVIPEEIESVINTSKFVSISKVYGQKSAFLGSLVVAEIVLANGNNINDFSNAVIKKNITAHCKTKLEAFKIPAIIKIVESIKISESGKMLRNGL